MSVRGRWLTVSILAVVSAVAVAACGSSSKKSGGSTGGKTLTIYSSLPLQGPTRTNSEATINGEKLALQQVGSKVGQFKIRYVSLDDSTAQAGKWDPGQTSANARKAAQDSSTIAYIGEFNSGATAISLPILNRAGILQVSPANTYVGLTQSAGAAPGEPQKYYPTGKRTYARVVPADTVQAAAIATIMKTDGCSKPYILNDKEVYGAGLASNTVAALKKQGITPLGNDGWDPKAANYRSVAAKLAGKGVDCVFLSGIVDNNGVQLTKDIAAGIPSAKIYAPDGFCESGWVDPKSGGVPVSLDSRLQCTVATLSPNNYPPAGKRFFQQYKATYGSSNLNPYAIYGYAAMSLVLDAIKRAGAQGNNRADVIKQVFATKNLPSVLGTYSITPTGDTTITDYGLYKVKNGSIVFSRVIKPSVG